MEKEINMYYIPLVHCGCIVCILITILTHFLLYSSYMFIKSHLKPFPQPHHYRVHSSLCQFLYSQMRIKLVLHTI